MQTTFCLRCALPQNTDRTQHTPLSYNFHLILNYFNYSHWINRIFRSKFMLQICISFYVVQKYKCKLHFFLKYVFKIVQVRKYKQREITNNNMIIKIYGCVYVNLLRRNICNYVQNINTTNIYDAQQWTTNAFHFICTCISRTLQKNKRVLLNCFKLFYLEYFHTIIH